MKHNPTYSVAVFLVAVKDTPARERDMMRRNGFVFDNLDDRWQKLAFTLYTDLVELSERADEILTVGGEA